MFVHLLNPYYPLIHSLGVQLFHPLSTNSLYLAHWAHIPDLLDLGYKLWPYNYTSRLYIRIYFQTININIYVLFNFYFWVFYFSIFIYLYWKKIWKIRLQSMLSFFFFLVREKKKIQVNLSWSKSTHQRLGKGPYGILFFNR